MFSVCNGRQCWPMRAINHPLASAEQVTPDSKLGNLWQNLAGPTSGIPFKLGCLFALYPSTMTWRSQGVTISFFSSDSAVCVHEHFETQISDPVRKQYWLIYRGVRPPMDFLGCQFFQPYWNTLLRFHFSSQGPDDQAPLLAGRKQCVSIWCLSQGLYFATWVVKEQLLLNI
jgi:hypothetical protein